MITTAARQVASDTMGSHGAGGHDDAVMGAQARVPRVHEQGAQGALAPRIAKRGAYSCVIERKAQITPEHINRLLATHLAPEADLRADHFDALFATRRDALCQLVEKAMGKTVPRGLDQGSAEEDSSQFELSEIEELLDESEQKFSEDPPSRGESRSRQQPVRFGEAWTSTES